MKFVHIQLRRISLESHPARGAWIEIFRGGDYGCEVESHPARGAWIEIKSLGLRTSHLLVAPRKGCVD